ncbi:ATP/GTP-binding protein [Candidatus Thiodubiliella endoseptemdiera]|uniref:AAA family ATPase n=1 Tax=Candidatus Thiodubiliella endoseptemdiera TaxID=2738886 RepID=UPI0034DDEBF0
MLKTNKNELPNNFTTVTLSTGKTLDVLNSAVIYGANASGKSNLVLALTTMLTIVGSSFNYKQNESIPGVESFAFTSNGVSEFEIDFINDKGVRFVYGFSATQEKFIDEWLYQYPKGRPQILISRDNTSTWGEMNALKGSKKLLKDSTKEVSLFLSTAYQFNNEQLSSVLQDIFTLKTTIVDFQDPHFTIAQVEENNKKQSVLDFLNNADIGIEDIIIESHEVNVDNVPEMARMIVEVDGIQQKPKYIETKIHIVHTDGIRFDLHQESSGTQKLFFLIGVWLDVIEKGYTLILDELQNSLHPKLVEHLITMFHDSKVNNKGAQLIFVTHETSLLSQEIFRRDQVWFCEKENNATELFSLADFSVRKGAENVEKFYLSGRYGAVPYLRS